jgi:DNA-binding NarL/FixJ family response regulator
MGYADALKSGAAAGVGSPGTRAPVGYADWQGTLFQRTVTAVPSERDASGNAMWTVRLTRDDGTVIVREVWLKHQFSSADLGPGWLKSQLEAALHPRSGVIGGSANGAPPGGTALVQRLRDAIGAFDDGAGRDQLNSALAAVRNANKSGWSQSDLANAHSFDAQAAKRLWPPKPVAKTVLAPNEQAMVSDAKARANDARYEMNALVQRRTGLKGIEQLPYSIANLTSTQLNASLNAIAQRYGYGEWMQLLSPGGRAHVQSRNTEISVLALTGKRPDQIRSELTTKLNVGAKTLTGAAPFISGKPVPTPPQAKNYANRALTELINSDPRFGKFRGKVNSVEQLAYYAGADDLWKELDRKLQGHTEGHFIAAKELLSDGGKQQLQAHATKTQPPASPQQVKNAVNAHLMKLIAGTKFEGKVFGLDSLMNYGDTEVAGLLAQLEPVARAGSSDRLGVRDLLPSSSAPKQQRVSDAMRLRDLKALNLKLDAANAEVAQHELQWGELSQTKNALQAAGDVVLGWFGDSAGFSRYDMIRSQLRVVHKELSEGRLTYSQASAQVNSLMADYREGHQQQVRGFGDRAVGGGTVLTAVKQVAPTAGALVIGAKTKGSPAGAVLAGTYSYGLRTAQDQATHWWYQNVYSNPPWTDRNVDSDVQNHAPKPTARSNARNLTLALGDAVMAFTFAKAPSAIAAGKLSFNGVAIQSTSRVLANTFALSSLTTLPTSLLSTAVDQRFNQATQERLVIQTKADLERWKQSSLTQQRLASAAERPLWLRKQAVLFENEKQAALEQLRADLAAQKQQAMDQARAALAGAPPDERQAALAEFERRLDQQIAQIYVHTSAGYEAQRQPAREEAERYFDQQQAASHRKLTKILDAKAEVVNFQAQAALDRAKLDAPIELVDQLKRQLVSIPISYGVGSIAGFLPQSKVQPVTKWTDPVKIDPQAAFADSLHGAFSGGIDTTVQSLAVDGRLPDRQTLIQAAVSEAFELPVEAGAARHSLNNAYQAADQALSPRPTTPAATSLVPHVNIPGLQPSGATPSLSAPASLSVQPLDPPGQAIRDFVQNFQQIENDLRQSNQDTLDDTTRTALNKDLIRATEAFTRHRQQLSTDDKKSFITAASQAHVLLARGRPSPLRPGDEPGAPSTTQGSQPLTASTGGPTPASKALVPFGQFDPDALRLLNPILHGFTGRKPTLWTLGSDNTGKLQAQLIAAIELKPGQRYRVLLATVPPQQLRIPPGRGSEEIAAQPAELVVVPEAVLETGGGEFGLAARDSDIYNTVFGSREYFEPQPNRILLHQSATSGGTLTVNKDGSLTLDPTSPLNRNAIWIGRANRDPDNIFNIQLDPTRPDTLTDDVDPLTGVSAAGEMRQLVAALLKRPVHLKDAPLQRPPATGTPVPDFPGLSVAADPNARVDDVLAFFDRQLPGRRDPTLQAAAWRNADARVVITDDASGEIVAAARGTMRGDELGSLDLIAVAPGWRRLGDQDRTGLGSTVVASIESQLKDQGAKTIATYTAPYSPNEHGLNAFYQRLGYEPSAEQPGHLDKRLGTSRAAADPAARSPSALEALMLDVVKHSDSRGVVLRKGNDERLVRDAFTARRLHADGWTLAGLGIELKPGGTRAPTREQTGSITPLTDDTALWTRELPDAPAHTRTFVLEKHVGGNLPPLRVEVAAPIDAMRLRREGWTYIGLGAPRIAPVSQGLLAPEVEPTIAAQQLPQTTPLSSAPVAELQQPSTPAAVPNQPPGTGAANALGQIPDAVKSAWRFALTQPIELSGALRAFGRSPLGRVAGNGYDVAAGAYRSKLRWGLNHPVTTLMFERMNAAARPVGDALGQIPNAVKTGWRFAVTQPTAALDALVNQPIEQSSALRAFGRNPLVRATGDGYNVAADAYRSALRWGQNNPLTTHTFERMNAAARQMRYLPQQSEAKKELDKRIDVVASAVGFYKGAAEQLDGTVVRATALANDIQSLQQQRTQTLEEGRIADARLAERQVARKLRQLEQLQQSAADPLARIIEQTEAQIAHGERLLKTQREDVKARLGSFNEAWNRYQRIDTPQVSVQRQRLNEARAPMRLALMVTRTKAAYEALKASVGPDSTDPALLKAQGAYEQAKKALAQYTLAGNKPILDMIIDRDDGLLMQLRRLDEHGAYLKGLVEGLTPDDQALRDRRARAHVDPLAAAQGAVDRLTEVQKMLGQIYDRAVAKEKNLRGSKEFVDESARIDQRSVDEKAAQSDFAGLLGRIGLLRSTAKDVFDGKGKGRIDQLSNVGNIEKVSAEARAVADEAAAWQHRIDDLDAYLRMAARVRNLDPQAAQKQLESLTLLRNDALRMRADARRRLENLGTDVNAVVRDVRDLAARRERAERSGQVNVVRDSEQQIAPHLRRLRQIETQAAWRAQRIADQTGALIAKGERLLRRAEGDGEAQTLAGNAPLLHRVVRAEDSLSAQIDALRAHREQALELAARLREGARTLRHRDAVSADPGSKALDALQRLTEAQRFLDPDTAPADAQTPVQLLWPRGRFALELRTAEPRSIQVRVDDIKAKVAASRKLLDKLERQYEPRQERLQQQIDALNDRIAASPSRIQRHSLLQERDALALRKAANGHALNRAQEIHGHTEELLPMALQALDTARATAGLTPGKIGRNALRSVIPVATLAKGLTILQLARGWVTPDGPAQLRPVLKQLNLPGSELPLPVEAIHPVPGFPGLHRLDTAQGPQYAWRVRGTFSDIVVVAQPAPGARGMLLAALNNGGKVGTLSPSVQEGSCGLYMTIDSQRIQLSQVTISSVFHPDPSNTALNWWETVKIEVGAFGVSTRVNTDSTHPRTGQKQPMFEIVGSNSIKAPIKFKNVKLGGVVPFVGDVLQVPDGVGVSVTVKNSLGVGKLSLVYDPEMGVGQISDRTSSWAGKQPLRLERPVGELNRGTQPYGFFGTAIRMEKSYYAINDPRNDGHWLMTATAPLEAAFDWATLKPIVGALGIETQLQRALDAAGPVIGRTKDQAVRDFEQLFLAPSDPPPTVLPQTPSVPTEMPDIPTGLSQVDVDAISPPPDQLQSSANHPDAAARADEFRRLGLFKTDEQPVLNSQGQPQRNLLGWLNPWLGRPQLQPAQVPNGLGKQYFAWARDAQGREFQVREQDLGNESVRQQLRKQGITEPIVHDGAVLMADQQRYDQLLELVRSQPEQTYVQMPASAKKGHHMGYTLAEMWLLARETGREVAPFRAPPGQRLDHPFWSGTAWRVGEDGTIDSVQAQAGPWYVAVGPQQAQQLGSDLNDRRMVVAVPLNAHNPIHFHPDGSPPSQTDVNSFRNPERLSRTSLVGPAAAHQALPTAPFVFGGQEKSSEPQPTTSTRTDTFVERHLKLRNQYADPATLTGNVFAFQSRFKATAELARFFGVPLQTVLQRMREDRVTALEALVQAKLEPNAVFGGNEPQQAGRFVTHPEAYRSNQAYGQLAETLNRASRNLLGRGVPSSVVASVIAENKQQFTLWNNPARTVEFNRPHPLGLVNGTRFLSDTESEGPKPDYKLTALQLADIVGLQPGRAQVFRIPGSSKMGFRQFVAEIARRDVEGSWSGGQEQLNDAAWTARRLRQAIETSDQALPILGDRVIRIPLDTPYGTGGAVYIREEDAPVVLKTGDRTTWFGHGQRIEVVLDQGTAALRSPEVGMRQHVSRSAYRALDQLLGGGGQSRQEALAGLAGVWYDLSVTSGGWMAGGAGTNHILMAAAYERLMGLPLPALSTPADLAAVSTTRDEFVRRFVEGELFAPGNAAAISPPGQDQPLQRRHGDDRLSSSQSQPALTDSQQRLLNLLAQNTTYAEVAERLGTTVGSVRVRVSQLRDKFSRHDGRMPAPGLAGLLIAAQRHGLIDVDPVRLQLAQQAAIAGGRLTNQGTFTQIERAIIRWLPSELTYEQIAAQIEHGTGKSISAANVKTRVSQLRQKVGALIDVPVRPGRQGLVDAIQSLNTLSIANTVEAPIAAPVTAVGRQVPELTPLETTTLALLGGGMRYPQIAAVLPGRSTTRQVADDVRHMLRKWGIEPPASAADLIVAAHEAGVIRANPTTLARASMTVRLREDLGVNLGAGLLVTDTTAFAVIEGWNRGESRESLSKSLNLSQTQMERHLREWAARFGLTSNERYETKVAQIVGFAREHGYLAATPGAVRPDSDGPARALDPITLPAQPRFTSIERQVIDRLAKGSGYAEIGDALHRPVSSIKADVHSALRKLGIEPPATAFDLIVSAHKLSLARVDSRTLRYAAAAVRMREDLGKRVQFSNGDARGFEVLEAWMRGVPKEALMSELDVSEAQLREFMRFWLDRFGLDGLRDYQRNVEQVADFAQRRRYFAPL